MSNRICIFGDSITWGAIDPENGGWVAQLRRYFETNNYDISIYNQGISGDNTNDLLARFEIECKAREPQVVIFAIGINDSQYTKSKGIEGISLEKFQNNLIKLIKQAKIFSDKIIFVGLTKVDQSSIPESWGTEKFYNNNIIATYNTAIIKVCKSSNLLFINLLDLLNVNDLSDGLHPNPEGHKKIFLKVKDFLLELLSERC